MISGTVVSIHLSPQAVERMMSVAEVRAVSGKGLEGDRYFNSSGTYSKRVGSDRQLTLIEQEAVDALRRDYEVALGAGESRRNIVTRGVALNHLVGREFRIGEVTVLGLRLCEPCRHLEKVTGHRVRAGLVHRGGLRAEILTTGTIRIGDRIEADELR